jgi:hypothetical protein
MRFGDHIRFLRLEKNSSLRRLAIDNNLDITLLSQIERNVAPLSQIKNVFDKLVAALQINTQDQEKLMDSISSITEHDICEECNEYQNIPVLLRTINNKKPSAEQIIGLAEKINREN